MAASDDFTAAPAPAAPKPAPTTKKPAPAPLEITTWYFAPIEQDEWQVCVAYMKKKRPQEYSEGLLLSELNLGQLGPADAVVVIGRGLIHGPDKTELRPVQKHQITGQTFDTRVAHSDVIDEVHESATIRIDATHEEPDGQGGKRTVPSYWAAVIGRHRQGGSLKRSEFLSALGAQAAGLSFKFMDGPSSLPPHLPQILTLHLGT